VKRAYIIFTILILFVILFSTYFIKIHSQINSPEITLIKSFNSSGAKPVSTEIYFWGKLGDKKFNNLDALKKFIFEFAKELGIEDRNMISSDTVSNDLVHEIEIRGTGGKNRMINISAQVGRGKENSEEKFLSVSVVQDLSNEGLEEIREKVLTVFKKFNIKPKINSCITGNFDGKLDYAQMNDVCRRIFKEAGARKVEGIRNGNFISISAYSPAIGNFIRVEENKVNLNLAMRYNSYENKTYIWLATPVIATEY